MTEQRGLHKVDELSQSRLWKTLDTVLERISSMEKSMSEIARLGERINSHDKTLSRFGKRIDNHDARLHESELWQASYGDRSNLERMIAHMQDEHNSLRREKEEMKVRIKDLESLKDVGKGHKDIGKEILKYILLVIVGVTTYSITRGP